MVEGGCLCGAVRIAMTGAPDRVAICHCMDCRKHHGAVVCGSSVFAASAGEVEVHLGTLDAPNVFVPEYESWTIRRESWLPPLPVQHHHARDRPVT